MAKAPFLTEVEWLAACLAPWALGPHPNFSRDVVNGPSLLALCSDGRVGDTERYQARLGEEVRQWEIPFVDTCRQSLFAETQAESVLGVAEFVMRSDLPLGARVAAALYASVGYSEMDQPEVSVRILCELAEDPTTYALDTGSSALCHAALQQQIAFRAYEAGEDAAAGNAASMVERILATRGRLVFESFPVSKGISWSSRQVQRDIAATLRANSMRIQSQLEGARGGKWVGVVRRRPGWIEHRIDGKALGRGEAFVAEEFEKRINSISARRTIGGADEVIREGAAADLGAELAGDLGRALSARQALGQLLILRDADDDWAIAEGVRLLRHADSQNALESALRWIRWRGPNAALRGSAERILGRPSFPARIGRGDLAILRYAADLLGPEQLAVAIEAVPNHLGASGLRGGGGWKRREEVWSTIARLVPGSRLDDAVAKDALEFMESEHLDVTLVAAMHAVLAAVDWAQVESATIDGWVAWARERVVHVDFDDLAYEIIMRLVPGDYAEAVLLRTDLELALAAVNNPELANELNGAAIARATQACVAALSGVRREAGEGVTSFGGPDPSELSAAFLARFPNDELWGALGDVLSDPRVDAQKKSRGLDRLVVSRVEIPPSVLEQLRSAWPHVAAVPSDDPFSASVVLPHLPAAIRAGAAFGILDRQELLSSVIELAASQVPVGRVEAARCVPVVVSNCGALEWGQVLLLQLSRDPDPLVVSEAASGLALVCSLPGGLDELVGARLTELLDSEGTLAPLSVLHGFQRALTDDAEGFRFPEDKVSAMAQGHPLRVVRGAAGEVLQLAGRRRE